MSSKPANNRGLKSSGTNFLAGRGVTGWVQSMSGLAMMALAQQALAKMQDKGVTPAQLLNKLAVTDLAPATAQPVAAEAQTQYINTLAAAQDQDTLMVQDLLDSIARDALALQGEEFQQDAQTADLMAPAYLQSMGLNFEMIQQSTDRVLLAQAASTAKTASDAGTGAAAPAAASAVDAALAGMSSPMMVGLAVLGAAALASGGGSSTAAVVPVPLTLAITGLPTTLAAGATAVVTFTFSKAPVGFATSFITATGGTISALAVSSSNPAVYTATFTKGTDMTAVGAITVSKSITDASGNAMSADVSASVGTVNAGKVVDGYVKDATVFVDLDSDGVKDANEPTAVTDATGGYSMASTVSLAGANLISLGGTDTQTGAPVNFMMAPAGLAVITPITTVYAVAYSATTGTAAQKQAAAAAVLTSLGLTGTTASALSFDPVASLAGATTATAAAAAIAFQTLAQNIMLAVQTANTLATGLGATGTAGTISLAAFNSIASLSATQLTALSSGSAADVTAVMNTIMTATVKSALSLADGSATLTGLSTLIAATAGATANVATLATAQSTAATAAATAGGTLASIKAFSANVTDIGQVGLNSLSQSVTTSAAAVKTVITAGGDVAAASATASTSLNTTYTTDAITTSASDKISPTVVVTSDLSTIATGLVATITFTFSENVIGFTASDITVTGGTLASLAQSTANSKVYTAKLTPTANFSGAVTVSVSDQYYDAAGNLGTAASLALAASTSPGVQITTDKTFFKVGDTAVVTFTFSAVPTGFDASDITVTGGVISNLTADTTGKIYTAKFTPTSAVDSLTGAISIAAGTFTNSTSNANIASNSIAITGDTLAPTAPTIALTTDSGTSTDLITNSAALTVSDAATGITRTYTVDSGTAASTYTAPTADGSHTVVVTDADAAGNTSSATLTFTLDKTAPTAPTIALTTDSGTSTD
ncbi:MAG: beta strand repeat-containing protein, partial [Limnohabitans sp.]